MKPMSMLSEKDVLRALRIPDFRHVSKEKLMQFASMLPYMDPEIAVKALEQFPHFVVAVKEISKDFKDIVDKSLESNNESTRQYYEIARMNISILQAELDKEGLSFDERKEIMSLLVRIQEMVSQKDSEQKKFSLNVIALAGGVFVCFLGLTASILGGNSTFHLPRQSA